MLEVQEEVREAVFDKVSRMRRADSYEGSSVSW